jgi:hypothetical protein
MAMSMLVPVTDYHITNFISNNVVFMQISEMGPTTGLFNVGPQKFWIDVIKHTPIASMQNVKYYNVKKIYM